MCVFVAQVYTTLACALFVSAVGVYMHMLLHIGGLITSLAFIATTMWLLSTPATPVNEVSLADGSLHLVSLWFVHSITQSQLWLDFATIIFSNWLVSRPFLYVAGISLNCCYPLWGRGKDWRFWRERHSVRVPLLGHLWRQFCTLIQGTSDIEVYSSFLVMHTQLRTGLSHKALLCPCGGCE
jgi:hypothetical protein